MCAVMGCEIVGRTRSKHLIGYERFCFDWCGTGWRGTLWIGNTHFWPVSDSVNSLRSYLIAFVVRNVSQWNIFPAKTLNYCIVVLYYCFKRTVAVTSFRRMFRHFSVKLIFNHITCVLPLSFARPHNLEGLTFSRVRALSIMVEMGV